MTEASENPAIVAAEAAQTKVDACLDAGKSFRLEAGAGAGKTYSLVAALKRIIAERGRSLVHTDQRVACITFTEVARDEIAMEIEDHPAILVETIHAFSWGFMAPFQSALRFALPELSRRREAIIEVGGVGERPVVYDRGFFRIDEDKISLAHDDIPALMARLLSHEKFKRLLTQRFPIMFIDEYQDTDCDFMAAIEEYVFNGDGGPLVGLFGDHWQTIYRSEYELPDYSVEVIDKGSNFRSVQPIVNVLNRLRPELPQVVSNPALPGEARFYHTNAYVGERTNSPHSKKDLPPVMAKAVRINLMERLKTEGWVPDKTKVLMLTHSVLAAEQGYPRIAEIFRGRTEQFVKKEDPVVKLLIEVVEPMCAAYSGGNYGEMFHIYGAGPAIRCHADKIAWRADMDQLLELRASCTIGQVLDHLAQTGRPTLTSQIIKRQSEFEALRGEPIPDDMGSLQRYATLREVPYAEIVEVTKFVEGFTPFATQHSVKGAEFENVLVILGGGWNHYNWPKLLELLKTKKVTAANSKGYYRSRNLFYVSVSRPMKRLAVLATQTLSEAALEAVTHLFGPDGVEELSREQLG